jgi:hypothetical protein
MKFLFFLYSARYWVIVSKCMLVKLLLVLLLLCYEIISLMLLLSSTPYVWFVFVVHRSFGCFISEYIYLSTTRYLAECGCETSMIIKFSQSECSCVWTLLKWIVWYVLIKLWTLLRYLYLSFRCFIMHDKWKWAPVLAFGWVLHIFSWRFQFHR